MRDPVAWASFERTEKTRKSVREEGDAKKEKQEKE